MGGKQGKQRVPDMARGRHPRLPSSTAFSQHLESLPDDYRQQPPQQAFRRNRADLRERRARERANILENVQGTATSMHYMYLDDPKFPADYARTLRMKKMKDVTDLDIEEAVDALADWSLDQDHAEFLYGAMRDLKRLANEQYEDSSQQGEQDQDEEMMTSSCDSDLDW
jgi:hypothetical protein